MDQISMTEPGCSRMHAWHSSMHSVPGLQRPYRLQRAAARRHRQLKAQIGRVKRILQSNLAAFESVWDCNDIPKQTYMSVLLGSHCVC